MNVEFQIAPDHPSSLLQLNVVCSQKGHVHIISVLLAGGAEVYWRVNHGAVINVTTKWFHFHLTQERTPLAKMYFRDSSKQQSSDIKLLLWQAVGSPGQCICRRRRGIADRGGERPMLLDAVAKPSIGIFEELDGCEKCDHNVG